eukprot:g885.t1
MPDTKAPSPSSGNIKRQGFTSWDYALCLMYLGLTFYVSFRSAFSGTSGKSTGLKSNGGGRRNEKGSDDDDDKASARSALLDHDNSKGANDSAASAASKSSRGDAEANAADKYFLAGRGANNIIVAISLLSGLTSGVSFLGVPAYGYENGIGVLFPIFVAQVIAGYVIAQLIIPFYSKLRLSTPYTYLERRFNRSVRTVAACLFCFRIIAYMTVVIQAPAILFKATAGVDGWITALVCGLFATIFTMKGGMKTVIITDFMQSLALIGGAVLTLILAIVGSNGLHAKDLNFEMTEYISFNSWAGDNFWYFFIGILFNSVGQSGTDQIAIQRLMSTEDVHSAKKATITSGWMNGVMSSTLVMIGLYMHSYYRSRGQNPLQGQTTSNNIMPYFLMEDSPPGFLGIVVAAVLGCTLSVLSGGLNSVAACFYVDIIQNVFLVVATPEKIVSTSRTITLIFGIIITMLAVLSTYVKIDIVNFSNIASGLFSGPVSVVFLLGMLSTRVNTRGIIAGFAFSIILIIYSLAGEITCVGLSSTVKIPDVCNGFLFYAQMNAWAVATILAIPTAVVALVVSYATERPSESQLRNLTWYSLREPGDVYNEDISVPYGTIADAHLDGDDNQAMSSPNEFVHNVINPRSIDGVE